MRVARFKHGNEQLIGIVSGDAIAPAGDCLVDPAPGGRAIPLSTVELLSPVDETAKIICVGLNYADHAEESGDTIPDEPLIFAKLPNSLIGPNEAVRIPDFSSQIDFEAELGVVIGRQTSNVKPNQAHDHVFGYTCINDISARDLQFGDGQWTRGKSLDTFCPVGPWVVTSDEIPDPQTLGIRCRLNGEVMQDSSTERMIFNVAVLISHISRGITLNPGDLIATGTPAGVGFTRKPPRFLRHGDRVGVEIDRIGSLDNAVVSARVSTEALV